MVIDSIYLQRHILSMKWYMKYHIGTKWPATGRKMQLDFDEEEGR